MGEGGNGPRARRDGEEGGTGLPRALVMAGDSSPPSPHPHALESPFQVPFACLAPHTLTPCLPTAVKFTRTPIRWVLLTALSLPPG